MTLRDLLHVTDSWFALLLNWLIIAAVSIRRITNAPHICEFCVGHADDYLRFIVPPMCIVSVVCLIIAIRQRKRKTAKG